MNSIGESVAKKTKGSGSAAKRKRRAANKAKRLRRIHELRSMPYREYLKTRHWRRLRVVAIKKAKHKCAVCGDTENLNVHHLTYERKGCEKLEDLQVLCRECHENVHEGEINGVYDPVSRLYKQLVSTF